MNTETWINKKWRPAMAWIYMATCVTDFIVFPVLWAIFQSYTGHAVEPWEPLTLKGAGLFHLSMGAILGVTAWSRGQEKISGVIDRFGSYESQTKYTSAESISPSLANNTDPSTEITRPILPPEPEL